jgi:hypothetical protein
MYLQYGVLYLTLTRPKFAVWEDIIRKKLSKLRSIAELRAFDGTEELSILKVGVALGLLVVAYLAKSP